MITNWLWGSIAARSVKALRNRLHSPELRQVAAPSDWRCQPATQLHPFLPITLCDPPITLCESPCCRSKHDVRAGRDVRAGQKWSHPCSGIEAGRKCQRRACARVTGTYQHVGTKEQSIQLARRHFGSSGVSCCLRPLRRILDYLCLRANASAGDPNAVGVWQGYQGHSANKETI